VISWHAGLAADLETESSAPVVYLDDLRGHIEKE
jgi:hypothetical protein